MTIDGKYKIVVVCLFVLFLVFFLLLFVGFFWWVFYGGGEGGGGEVFCDVYLKKMALIRNYWGSQATYSAVCMYVCIYV